MVWSAVCLWTRAPGWSPPCARPPAEPGRLQTGGAAGLHLLKMHLSANSAAAAHPTHAPKQRQDICRTHPHKVTSTHTATPPNDLNRLEYPQFTHKALRISNFRLALSLVKLRAHSRGWRGANSLSAFYEAVRRF